MRLEVEQQINIAVLIYVLHRPFNWKSISEKDSIGINSGSCEIDSAEYCYWHYSVRFKVDAVGVASWIDINVDLDCRYRGLTNSVTYSGYRNGRRPGACTRVG